MSNGEEYKAREDIPKPAPPVAPEPYFGCAFVYAPCESERPRRVEMCWLVVLSARKSGAVRLP